MSSNVKEKYIEKNLNTSETAKFLTQSFGDYFDFSECKEGKHPLIDWYLFDTLNEGEAEILLQEIRWILEGVGTENQLTEDILHALQGLKITIDYYKINTWAAAKSILNAEKIAFRSNLQELTKPKKM